MHSCLSNEPISQRSLIKIEDWNVILHFHKTIEKFYASTFKSLLVDCSFVKVCPLGLTGQIVFSSCSESYHVIIFLHVEYENTLSVGKLSTGREFVWTTA